MRRIAMSLVGLAGMVLSLGSGAAIAEELAIGASGPTFNLLGVDGEKHALKDFLKASKATVVVFTCNTCPFSKAYEPVLMDLAERYQEEPVSFVLINPNSVKLREGDSFPAMVERAKERGFPFPYLHDESQEIARAYGALTTPHVFALDAKGILKYRGRINDNAKAAEVKSNDLIEAIDAMLAGEDVPTPVTKAFGCSIKWDPDKKSS